MYVWHSPSSFDVYIHKCYTDISMYVYPYIYATHLVIAQRTPFFLNVGEVGGVCIDSSSVYIYIYIYIYTYTYIYTYRNLRVCVYIYPTHSVIARRTPFFLNVGEVGGVHRPSSYNSPE
jgi:hypothetical protein